MRGIAASRAQRGRALLAAIDAYSTVVSQAIGGRSPCCPPTCRGRQHRARASRASSCLAPSRVRRRFQRARSRCRPGRPFSRQVLLIGTRGAATAAERGLVPAWSTPMASNVEAIPALANAIADALYDHIATEAIRERHRGLPSTAGSAIGIDRHSLLPLDLQKFRQPAGAEPPLTNLPTPA